LCSGFSVGCKLSFQAVTSNQSIYTPSSRWLVQCANYCRQRTTALTMGHLTPTGTSGSHIATVGLEMNLCYLLLPQDRHREPLNYGFKVSFLFSKISLVTDFQCHLAVSLEIREPKVTATHNSSAHVLAGSGLDSGRTDKPPKPGEGRTHIARLQEKAILVCSYVFHLKQNKTQTHKMRDKYS